MGTFLPILIPHLHNHHICHMPPPQQIPPPPQPLQITQTQQLELLANPPPRPT
jgi:hypothetical protein